METIDQCYYAIFEHFLEKTRCHIEHLVGRPTG